MNVLVFSKDRACQLDLFLRSVKKFWNSGQLINIIYTFSNSDFEHGYNNLIYAYKDYNLNFIYETNFKENILSCIEDDLIVFFMDDNVFKNPFSNDCKEMKIFKNSDFIACLSLRLNPHMNFCYPKQCTMTPVCKQTWKWRLEQYDFNYPMSLDGHVFKTSDIFSLLRDLNYDSPNILESQLAMNPIKKEYMMCFEDNIIFNIPMNRVQKVFMNQSGNISLEFLNTKWLAGQRISLDVVDRNNRACHEEVELKWL